MKFGVLLVDGQAVLATLLGDRWVDLGRATADFYRVVEGKNVPKPQDVGDLLRNGWMSRSFYRRIAEFVQRNGRLPDYLIAETQPTFLLPWRPGKIIAVGRNFRAHVAEFDNQVPREPVYFSKAPTSCIGSGEAIVIGPDYGRVDYEGELGVVIGARGRHVSVEGAQHLVAGYTLVNDVTARDLQRKDMAESNPWFRSKSADTFCPIGPILVMAEVLDWPVLTPLETRVNGELRQKSDTSRFIFSIAEVIAAITRFITLEPGDLIAMGTPEGVGPLNGGDVVEVSNPHIGTLWNPVQQSPDGTEG
jgi:2-keto-4-pentenoate hydratase/2-oxohepta-3-ene-1,7-dioic acid hydratase in catechol pathway